jgi:ATP-binding cassette subfamily B protein
MKAAESSVETADNSPSKNDDEGVPPSAKPSLWRLLKLAKPESIMLFLSFIFTIATEATNLITPLIVANAFDALINPNMTDDERMDKINYWMLWAVIITILGILASFLRAMMQGVIGERIVARLRCHLYGRILQQEIAFFDEHKSGELVSRLGSDTTLLQMVVSQSLPEVITQFVKVIAALLLMFYISSKLAGLALGGVLVIFMICLPTGKLMGQLSKAYQDVLGGAQNHSTEAISSMRTVQSFAAERKEIVRYESKIGNPDDVPLWWPTKENTTYRVGFFKSMVNAGFFSFVFGAGFGYLNVTLWYGFWLVLDGQITLGELTAFNSYIISIGFALGLGAQSVAKVYEGLGAGGRVFYLLDRVPLIPEPPSSPKEQRETIKPETMVGDVVLENVYFSYPSRPDQPVLNGVSLTIPANKTTALVGGSGAGKSTVVSLLQRFYDINQGSITVDGHDIKSLDLTWLRQNVGYVQQEPQLFGLSIRENMLYGVDREVSQEELEAASKDANAHDFISEMTDGYDTLVGERGVQLSGGQKQRVAIARALMCKPRILLLDEATSALDAESEHLVQQAIEKAVIGRTVIIVAHRLSTIRRADQIVVMDNHQVVDVGKHDELMTKCAKYHDLIKRQSVMIRDVSKNGLANMLEESEMEDEENQE